MSTKWFMPLLALAIAPTPAHSAMKAASLNEPIMRASSNTTLGKADDSYLLAQGSVLINATKTTQLKSACTVVELEKGSVALITREQGFFRVANLCESKKGSIKVIMADKTILLPGGTDFVLAKNPEVLNAWLSADRVARRNMELTPMKNGEIYTVSEFSVPTLIQHSGIVKAMCKSDVQQDKEVISRVLKFTICLSLVTGSHGNYELMDTKPQQQISSR